MTKNKRLLLMKHINLLLTLLIIFPSASFSQISVKSEVKEVTVFSSQAQITREQSVKLEKGFNKVKFIGLENAIFANTIQASSTGGVTILSTDVRSEISKKEEQPFKIRKLLDSLDALKRLQSLQFKAVKNLEAEKNAILYNKSANGANSGFNLDNMIDLAEYYRNNLTKLDALIYDKNEEAKNSGKTIQELNLKLAELGYKKRVYVMNLEVISERVQTVSMKLVYVVNKTGWTPFYEIKSDGLGNKIKAICKAKIYQNTQADWKNVKLTLSTTSPTNVGTLPTVHPWVLRFQSDAKRYRKSKARNQRADYNGAVSNRSYTLSVESAAYDSKSMADYTNSTENMVSREFSVSMPYSIKGSNSKSVVELEKFDIPAEYLYYSAPKYNCKVFLIANITEWEKYNFLPGSANLFLEGTYVGKTFINPNATEDTMSLVLGIDKSISITREKTKDYSRNTLLGGKKKVDMGIQITVKNKKGVPIDLILEDQVPISSSESIEIDVKDISKAKKEDATGKLTWKENIKSGETKVFKIKYEVKYPKNKPLSNF